MMMKKKGERERERERERKREGERGEAGEKSAEAWPAWEGRHPPLALGGVPPLALIPATSGEGQD